MVERRSGLRATAGVGIMFATNGSVFAALLPWYPLIAAKLELSAAQFGFTVAAFAVGAIASSALPAPLIARFGPVRVAIGGTVLVAAAIASVAWVSEGWMLAICLFLAGFVDAVVDVAQNVAGIRVQEAIGRPILSSMHAFWSLGGVVSGAVSTASAASGGDIRVHTVVVGVLCIALVAGAGAMIGTSARAATIEAATDDARPRRWRLVAIAALPLVIIALSGTMVEAVANNGAAMAGVQLAGLAPEAAGIAFTVVIGSQCVGRFTGDLLIRRFGAVAVGRLGGVLVVVGGVLVVVADGPVLLFAGLALAGYGSATLVPSALGAAARIPGVSEGAGVTIVSWLMRVGFLVTSPIVGGVTDLVDLRWGLVLLIVAGVVAVVMAPALGRRTAR